MKRSRLRPRSKKTEALYRARREMVSRLLQNAVCAVRWDDGCSGTATGVHEPLTRARGGSIVDPENAVVSCWQDHNRIHENPSLSECYGFLLPSWATPEDVQVAKTLRQDAYLRYGEHPQSPPWRTDPAWHAQALQEWARLRKA